MRVVRSTGLHFNTLRTSAMTKAAAIDKAKAGANRLRAGIVDIQPDAKIGAHHHGHIGSTIYAIRGRARMRWVKRLEFMAEAAPAHFIYVPPFVPHQKINASAMSLWIAWWSAATRSPSSISRLNWRRRSRRSAGWT